MNKRVKHIQLSKPIVYGNVATPLGEDRPAGINPEHTHSWTVFVRDPAVEDNLQLFIKKVVFHLHASYDTPARVVELPPFEVTETGWGEFEIGITIHFHAPEKALQVFHHLRLHPYGADTLRQRDGTEVVESVVYDEILFNEPPESLFAQVTAKPGSFLHQHKTPEMKFSRQLETQELDRIGAGLEVVMAQIAAAQQEVEQLNSARELVVKVEEE